MSLVSPAQGVFTGATFSVGALEWLSINSDAITPGAVIVTALAAVIFGFFNAKSSRMIAVGTNEANRINKRDVTSDIMDDLINSGKSKEYIEDLKESLRR